MKAAKIFPIFVTANHQPQSFGASYPITNIQYPTMYVLASKSPRRQQLLQEAGLPFRIITQSTDESYDPTLSTREIVSYIAAQKAKAVFSQIEDHETIISADTIVCLGSTIFGKPKDEADAFRIIRALSGRVHEVMTGICLLSKEKEHCFVESTKVYFGELTDDQIHYYIQHYQPFDKAGAYAIQEWIGMVGIEKIEGDYFNVVGLPVCRLFKELKKF
ncbi:MAG: Maf family protein [Chitinophagales bacterium]